MKNKAILAVMTVVCAMVLTNISSAIIVRSIDIDFVTIGNPGNPSDTGAEANPYNCGSVGYEYSIGKYEVTHATSVSGR